jgi:hypothetical protein
MMVPRQFRVWTGVAAASLSLTACEAPAPQEVARVGDWALTRPQLADLLVLAQPLPLDSATVASLVDEWVTLAALSQRIAAGADPSGPEATEASLWLETREAVLEAERRDRLGAEAAVTPARAATMFQADTFLLLAHVLRRTSAVTSAAEQDLQRRTAQEILDGLVAGGSWDEAVAQSEDFESRGASGLMGLLRVEELPPSLRGAGGSLLPGQVSSVVQSPQGFHVLYRPRFEDVSRLFVQLLGDRLLEEADLRANAAWAAPSGLAPAPGGVEALREMAASPTTGFGSAAAGAPLATWTGGELPRQVVARHVAALPSDARARLSRADEGAAADFLSKLAVREARLRQAEERGVSADPEALQQLADLHQRDVVLWKSELRGQGTLYDRQALDRYMERLVSRQADLRPVPPLLRAWLMEPLSWSVDARAANAAAATARELIEAAGSETR